MEEGKKSSLLITGGAGFIGSNLCEYFLSKGHQVVCLDNFATGHRHNIKDIINNPEFRLIEGDIRNISDCQNAVNGVDYVLHQAALGSVPRSIKDPVTTNEVNVTGFLNMLTAARDAKVKRFVYAASSSTYGDSQGLPKVEDVIGKPLSPYAITKYVNELYAEIQRIVCRDFQQNLWNGNHRLALFQCFWTQAGSQWSLCCRNSEIRDAVDATRKSKNKWRRQLLP